jgi:DNA-binding NarL/FixJ family response regulator
MSWKRFWSWLLRRPPPGEDPLASLRRLARNQGRSLDAVTYELLAHSRGQQAAGLRSGPLWAAFTPREQDVAILIYAGYSNSEIAYLLGLGVETVRSHIQRMLRKCDLHSKAELCLALRSEGSEAVIEQRLEGLLDPPPPPGVKG